MASIEGSRRIGELEIVESPLCLRHVGAPAPLGPKAIVLVAVLGFSCAPMLARESEAVGLVVLLTIGVVLQAVGPILWTLPRRRRGNVLDMRELRLVEKPRAMIDVDGRLFPIEDLRDVVLTEDRVRRRFGKSFVSFDVWLLLAGAVVHVLWTTERAEASAISAVLRDALGLDGPAPVLEAPLKAEGILGMILGFALLAAASLLFTAEDMALAMGLAAAAAAAPALLHVASARARGRATLSHFGVGI